MDNYAYQPDDNGKPFAITRYPSVPRQANDYLVEVNSRSKFFKKPKFYKILSAILVVLVLLLLIVVIILSVLCKFKNVSFSDFPINPNTRHSRLQYILRESDMHFRRVPSLCGKSAFVVGLQRQPLRRLLQIHLRTLVQRTP
jgi:hypothetical protein